MRRGEGRRDCFISQRIQFRRTHGKAALLTENVEGVETVSVDARGAPPVTVETEHYTMGGDLSAIARRLCGSARTTLETWRSFEN